MPRANVQEHLSAAVRDLVCYHCHRREGDTSEVISDNVFEVLRNAHVFRRTAVDHSSSATDLDRLFGWGGHSLDRNHEGTPEYNYTKAVGRELALLFHEWISGGGPGAMRGQFSGALGAYSEQRIAGYRSFGYTCPSIITSEPPNNLVNPLVILPNIEMRLEAFVRSALGGVIFPGGVGTAEELMYILAILMDDRNKNLKYPLILTGPKESEDYFVAIDTFLKKSLGIDATDLPYEIVIGDAKRVARLLAERVSAAKKMREALGEGNTWFSPQSLTIPYGLQKPFDATHENMATREIHRDQPIGQLLTDLRAIFSGIVAGNVTDKGIQSIREQGPFQINGDVQIMKALDELLTMFSQQGRMRMEGEYDPCYEVVTKKSKTKRRK